MAVIYELCDDCGGLGSHGMHCAPKPEDVWRLCETCKGKGKFKHHVQVGVLLKIIAEQDKKLSEQTKDNNAPT